MSLAQQLNHGHYRDTNYERYLEATATPCLQLGAGTNVLERWFNTDLHPIGPGVFQLDSSKPFPMHSDSFAYVFSEHHLEHLSIVGAQNTVKECLRVLKPGGVLRVATPDFSKLLGLLEQRTLSEPQRYYIDYILRNFSNPSFPQTVATAVNLVLREWGHQFVYDQATLSELLIDVGFSQIESARVGRSRHAPLIGVEGHGEFLGDASINLFETMVVEAVKPS